ncbi:MAG TPA: ABC transporter permease [Holophagaceae bacterium]|nr:ABC transporter permease [Holophagaceae bacterium]
MASFIQVVSDRYLRARRKGAFVKVMVRFALVGTALGVFAMVICMALMNGFREEIQATLFRATAHFSLAPYAGDVREAGAAAAKLRAVPGVAGVSPMRLEKGLLKGGAPDAPPEGVVIKAVDPATAASTSSIFESTTPLRIADLQDGQILIGQELARILSLRVGDTVTVAFMRLELGLGGVQPKFAAFKVVGTFQSHISEYDRGWAFITLADGLRIARAEGPEFLEVRAEQLEAIDEVKGRAQKAMGPGWLSTDLRDTNKQLFAALRVEKWIFTGILSLIVCIAAFNIVASLVLLITEKRRDLGTLLALGATPDQVAGLFQRMGLRIGLVGTAWGLGLAIPTCLLADHFKLVKLPASVYDFITYVPFRLTGLDVIIAAVFPLLVAWLASRLPAKRAASVDPVDSLRAE